MSIAELDNALKKAFIFLEDIRKDAQYRLHDILVEEVSFVDRAANRRKFLVVKRSGGTMDPEKTALDGQAEASPEESREEEKEEKVKIPDEVKVGLMKIVQEGIERLVSLGNIIKDAEETAERVEKPLDPKLASEFKAISDIIMSALSRYPSPQAMIDDSEAETEVKDDVGIENKAMGEVARTLRSVGETALSLAKASGEQEELDAGTLASLRKLAASLNALAEKYPQPTAGKAEASDEAKQVLDGEEPVTEEPLVGELQTSGSTVAGEEKGAETETVDDGKGSDTSTKEDQAAPVAKESARDKANDILWAVRDKIDAGALMSDDEKTAVDTILAALVKVVKGETEKRAVDPLPLSPEREPGDLGNIGTGPEDKLVKDSPPNGMEKIIKRLDELKQKVAELESTPAHPASRRETVSIEDGKTSDPGGTKNRWVL